MKRFLLMLALWLSIVAGAVAQTAKPNILIITGGGTIEKEIADKMEAELSDRYNITRHYSGSVSLDGFTQIYDLRIDINDHDYPRKAQREAYVKFLNAAKGNSLFLLGGPMSNYNSRGMRINDFITEAGGGPVKDIVNDYPGDPEILKAPFASGPNSLTTISLGEKGGRAPVSGTGTYLSTHPDGTPGCGLYFAQGTLANAPSGCLVVLYSFSLMRDNDALRANIEHVMAAGGTLPGPTASSISLSVTPSLIARGFKSTFTATAAPDATGTVKFIRNDREVLATQPLVNGVATYEHQPPYKAATYRIAAQYFGDASYNASSSETVNLVVCGMPMYPTSASATAGDGQATVSFTPPTSDGGSPITSYTVTASPGGITATGTSSPITVTGLTNGTAYTFKVKASNGPNTSMDSDPSNSVTPMHTSVITYPTEAPYGTAIGEGLLGATADVPGMFDYTPAKGTVLNIGNNQALTVTFTPTDKGNTTASKAVTVNVTKAPLAISEPTVTTTKEYDGSNVATITSPGEVSGIVAEANDVRVIANAQFDDANAGTGKTITVTYTLEGANKDCYLAPAPRTLTGEIKPQEIRVTADPIQKTYGDKDFDISFTMQPFLSYRLLTGSLSRAEGEDVGIYPITIGDLQPTSSNYKFTLAEGYYKIVPKRLYLISPPAITKVYDGTTKVTTPPSVGGIIPDDDASVAVTASYYDKNVGTGRTVTYTFAISGSHAGNYTLPVASPIYSAVITPASLTVTPNNIDKRVEQAYSFAGTEFTTSGLFEGDELTSVTLTSDGAAASAAVGTYSIAASNAQGTDVGNYSISYNKGSLTVVDKITPTISWANPAAITYGTALGDAQLSATASYNGAAVAGTFSYTDNGNAIKAGDILAAGDHTLKVTFTPTDAVNYHGMEKAASLTVSKAPLTVTASSHTITKGEAIPTLSVSYKGFVNGEDESVLDTKPTATTTATATTPVGEYATVAAGGIDGNYNFTYVDGTLAILDKRIPTVTWAEPNGITYGTPLSDAQLNATASYSEAAVAGAFTYAPALGATLAAGKHDLKVTFTPTDGAHYISVEKAVTITVAKAPLTATASSYSIREGESIPVLGITYSGFVNGDTEAMLDTKPTATTTATATSPTGVYRITVAGGADDNYEFAYVAGMLTVSNPIVVNALQAPQPACEGDKLSLAYTLTSGRPTEYQIVFDAKALAAGFDNSGYAALADNGTVSFSIPARVADGTYQGALQLRDGYGNISELAAFQVTVNVSADVIVPKFGSVVLIDNHEGRFTGYQWYRNGSAIGGATNQYYKDPNGLSGTYYAQLKTATGQTVNTCSKALSLKKSAQASVSVYPNPARAGQELTVKLAGFADEELQGAVLSVYSSQGAPVLTSRKVEQENRITLSGTDGVYMGRITTADGQVLTFKVVLAN